MIAVWRGGGPVVLIIGIVACLFTNIVTSKLFDENNYFQGHLWPKIAALVTAGVGCWFFGKYLYSLPPRLLRNHKGEDVLMKYEHDFMMIKVQYWGVIYVLIAFVVLAVNVFSAAPV